MCNLIVSNSSITKFRLVLDYVSDYCVDIKSNLSTLFLKSSNDSIVSNISIAIR